MYKESLKFILSRANPYNILLHCSYFKKPHPQAGANKFKNKLLQNRLLLSEMSSLL